MKALRALGVALAAAIVSSAAALEVPAGASVYLLPMGSGMEQFLASRLADGSLLRVVTDPKRAQVVLTDRIGESLEQKLNDLYPPPAPPKPPKPEPKAGDKGKSEPEETSVVAAMASAEKRQHRSTFGGNRGTFFLVDLQSRQVLWSTFEKPKNSSARELDRTSERLVNRLKKALGKSGS